MLSEDGTPPSSTMYLITHIIFCAFQTAHLANKYATQTQQVMESLQTKLKYTVIPCTFTVGKILTCVGLPRCQNIILWREFKANCLWKIKGAQ